MSAMPHPSMWEFVCEWGSDMCVNVAYEVNVHSGLREGLKWSLIQVS